MTHFIITSVEDRGGRLVLHGRPSIIRDARECRLEDLAPILPVRPLSTTQFVAGYCTEHGAKLVAVCLTRRCVVPLARA